MAAADPPGPSRRVDPAWVGSLRDQANAAKVAFFFPQSGSPIPGAGGRLLDGRSWDQDSTSPDHEATAP